MGISQLVRFSQHCIAFINVTKTQLLSVVLVVLAWLSIKNIKR